MTGNSMSDDADAASSSDVAHFVSLTNCPMDQATFFLEASNGNMDQALEMYYGELVDTKDASHVTYTYVEVHDGQIMQMNFCKQ